MEKLTFLEHLVSLKPVVGEPQYLESKDDNDGHLDDNDGNFMRSVGILEP